MSLDGFIAGPNDGMDWMVRFVGPNPVVDEVIQTIGAALGGRRTYDLGRKPGLPPEFRKIYGGAWSGPVFVLTHHAPGDCFCRQTKRYHFRSRYLKFQLTIALNPVFDCGD